MSRQIPKHKHKASDIVETEDSILLPYLRSPRDPSKIERAIIQDYGAVPRGTDFPPDPIDGQLFCQSDWNMVFRWDEANNYWISIDYDADSDTSITVNAAGTEVTVTNNVTDVSVTKHPSEILIDDVLTDLAVEDHSSGVTTQNKLTGITVQAPADRSIPEASEDSYSGKQIDSSWTDLATYNPSHACEEGIMYFCLKVMDATPSYLKVRVKVGTDNYYPDADGLHVLSPEQKGVISFNIIIPRNLNGAVVKPQAKQPLAANEAWDVYTKIYLNAKHSHGINEDAHKHSTNDPPHPHSTSENPHDHPAIEPWGGLGHLHGISENGHDHPTDDPTHPHDITDPLHSHDNLLEIDFPYTFPINWGPT